MTEDAQSERERVESLLKQVADSNFPREMFASIFKENYMNAIEQHHSNLLEVHEAQGKRTQDRPSSAPSGRHRQNNGRRAERREEKGKRNVSESIMNPDIASGHHKKRPLSASGNRSTTASNSRVLRVSSTHQREKHQKQQQQHENILSAQLRIREKQLESKAERIERRKEAVRMQMEIFRTQEKQLQKEEQEVEEQRRQLSPKRAHSTLGLGIAMGQARGNPVNVARSLAQSQSTAVVDMCQKKERSRKESEKSRQRLYTDPRQHSKYEATQFAKTSRRATLSTAEDGSSFKRSNAVRMASTKLYEAPSSKTRITKECLASIAQSSTPLRGVILPSQPIENMHQIGGARMMVRRDDGRRENRPLEYSVVCKSTLREPRLELLDSFHLSCVLFDLNMQVLDIASLFSAGAHPPSAVSSAASPVVPTQVSGIALSHSSQWHHSFNEAASKRISRAPSKFGSRYDRKPSPIRDQAGQFPSDEKSFAFSRSRRLGSLSLSDFDSSVFAVAFVLERPQHMDYCADQEIVSIHAEIVAEERPQVKRLKKKDGGVWSRTRHQARKITIPPQPPEAEEISRYRLMETCDMQLDSGQAALMGCIFRHQSKEHPWYSNAVSRVLPGNNLVSRIPFLVASMRRQAVVPYKLLHIEHCCNCEKHTMGTWHVPGSYENLASKVTKSITEELPSTLVLCNAHRPQKTALPNGKNLPGATDCREVSREAEQSPRPPRLGAFEVVLQEYGSGHRTLVYSKISSKGFPSITAVVEAVAQLCRPRKFRLRSPKSVSVDLWDSYYSSPVKGAIVQLIRIAILEGDHTQSSQPFSKGTSSNPAVVVKDWKRGRGLPPQRHDKIMKKSSESEVAATRAQQILKKHKAMNQVMLAARSPAVASVLAWGENDVLNFLAQHGVQGTPDFGMLNEFRCKGIVTGGKLLSLTDKAMQDIGLHRKDIRAAILATISGFKRQNGISSESQLATSTVSSGPQMDRANEKAAITQDFTDNVRISANNHGDATVTALTDELDNNKHDFWNQAEMSDKHGGVEMDEIDIAESDEHGSCVFQVFETGYYVATVNMAGFSHATSRIIRIEDGPEDGVPGEEGMTNGDSSFRICMLPIFNRLLVEVEDDREPPQEGEIAHNSSDLEGLVISLFNWRSEKHHRAVTDRQGRIDLPALPSGDYLLNVGMQSVQIGFQQLSSDSSCTEKLVISAKAAIARNKCKNKDAVVSKKVGNGAGWSDPKIWAVATIQALLRRFIQNRHEVRQSSAIKVQSIYRGYSKRWRYQAGRRMRVATKTILLAQKFARCLIHRQQWRDFKKAVLQIQRNIRRFLACLHEEIRFRAAMKIQALARRKHAVLSTFVLRLMADQTKAATLLQSVWRGAGVHQYYTRIILPSARIIQKVVRSRQNRKFRAQLRVWAADKCRKIANSSSFAALLIQTLWRKYHARKDTPPFYRIWPVCGASLGIQYAGIEGVTSPEKGTHYGAITEACVRIQRQWRGYRLRWLLWLITCNALSFSYTQGCSRKVRALTATPSVSSLLYVLI